MRIAIGGISHESNTFVAEPTPLAAFADGRVAGEELIPRWRDTHHEIAGFIEGADRFGYECFPLMLASATPGGPVTDDALDDMVGDLIARLNAAPAVDALLLALHGAMSCVSYPDGDGEVLRRVRAGVGGDFPLIVTHDFHCNVSDTTAELADALVVYQSNPHIDQRQRGLLAAEIAAKTARGEVSPTTVVARPPMLWNILHQNTSVDPFATLLADARELESRDGILAVSPYAGYPYADVWEVGCGAVIVTDGDADLARQEAERFAGRMWAERENLVIDLPDAEAAVRQAIAAEKRPVVMVDMGDNIGGGSPGDHTLLLDQLQRQGATGFVVVLYDPGAARVCQEAGVGKEVTLYVGGHHDPKAGMPVRVSGTVTTLHDGPFEELEPRHGGRRHWSQGDTAVIDVGDGNRVVVNSNRTPPFSLHQLTSLSIDPEQIGIVTVKAAIAYRAAYEPIAGTIIEVDTPGVTAVNPRRFDYHQARRPLWPLT